MPTSNYSNGFAYGVTIRGVPLLSLYSGKVWWVDSVNGNNGNKGTFDKPFGDANYTTAYKASAGDIVVLKAGHVETISAAGSLTCSVAGVCYVFLGQGSQKAQLNFTATAGTVLITGAGVTFVMPKFLTGIDALVSGIVVQAADFAIVDAEDYDATSMNALIMVLTTSAAARLSITGYRFFGATGGTQKTDRIKTVGALDGCNFQRIDITGDFSNEPINLTNAACTNVKLVDLNLNNTNASPSPALGLHANTTGFADFVKLRIASGTTYVSSTAKLQWGTGCLGYASDGSGGSALGAATDITAQVGSVGTQVSALGSVLASVGVLDVATGSQTTSIGAQVSGNTSICTSVAGGTSIILSTAQSVGLIASTLSTGVSTVQSKADSVGMTASINTSILTSVAARVSVAESKVDSVGIAAVSVGTNLSTNVSRMLSVGIQASNIDSKAISVGTGVSTLVSTVASVGVQTSIAGANALSVASQATSIGIGTSQATSTGLSVGIATSQIQSTLISIGLVISYIKSKCG
jgi:hypothetical protein